ncbi:unnamed protein product [Triticum turgidum subsp. durum]|uniref:Mitochondrial carrier protein n=1 Tax=Triticum turgidum subsp. durum TaxID=4567 RepID=A0A9R0TAV7_TRITD|nr:unnamed protein product [Triticum turgidum subsp. durum]
MDGLGDAAKEYIAGSAAGVAQVVVGHPFDTVKVKLQAHNTTAHGKVYKNAFHCTSRILVEEGIRGLYKGASSSFIGIALESSLFFGTYAQAKQLLQGKSEDFVSEYTGGMIQVTFDDVISRNLQCRMQVQGKDVMYATRYSSPLDCAVKTLQREGVRGIFRGGLATLYREAIGNAVFFCTYEYSRYWMHNYIDSPQFSSNSGLVVAKDIGIGIMSGGLSGMAYFTLQFWTATLPLDVAKTIIQTDHNPQSSRNPFRVLNMVYRRAGLAGCYAGLGPTLARAFPANAAAIVAWEYSAKILGIRRE